MPACLKLPKLSPRAKKAANTLLDVTIRGLEGSKEVITAAAPVPGLSVALDVTIELLKMIQNAQSNCDALKLLCDETTSLMESLKSLAKIIETGLDEYPSGSPERAQGMEKVSSSSKLLDRVRRLESDLRAICAEADTLRKQTRFGRFLHSSGDAEAVTRMKDRIVAAHRRFQVEGGVETEALVIGILRDVKEVIAALRLADEERILNSIPRADDALYLSAANAMKARLLKGTRERILKSLEEWVEAPSQIGGNGTQPVCVLVGEAGTGKSTVASEFSKRLEKYRLLAASYLFTRGLPDLNSTKKVFSTIAWQLAQLQPAVRGLVVDAAREHLKAGTLQQLERQFEDLIDRPLRSLPQSHSPIFVVVDGLDECTEEGPELLPRLLRLLLSAAVRPGSPLRLLLITRPEPQYIHEVFGEFEHHIFPLTMQQFRDTVDKDINCFIRAKLAEHKTSKSWLDSDPYIVDTIVNKSEGLFIYARTVIDFVLTDHDLPLIEERYSLLKTVEGSSTGMYPLDQLYRAVLESVLPPSQRYAKMQERLQRVLGYLVALRAIQGISPVTLEMLTGMPTTESVPILNKLRSLIIFERDNVESRFRIIHATFREFLVNPNRAGDVFYVSLEAAHGRLADECTSAMESFRQGYWQGNRGGAVLLLRLFVEDHFTQRTGDVSHFLYACRNRDYHRQLQDPWQLHPIGEHDSDLPPLRLFMSYLRSEDDGAMWSLMHFVSEKIRQSLPVGSKVEDVLSIMDNCLQDPSIRKLLEHAELIAVLSVILDLQAMVNGAASDAIPDDARRLITSNGATLDDQHFQELKDVYKKAPSYYAGRNPTYRMFHKAHLRFHQAMTAAGLTPGHQFEDEYATYYDRRWGRDDRS